jgi:small-conductance mechanosensitive channel
VSLIPALGIVVGVLVVAFLGHATSYLVLRRRVSGGRRAVADSFVRNTRRPNQVLLPLGTAAVAVALVPLPGALRSDLLHGIGIALILAAAWLLVRLTYVLEDAVLARYRLDAADNLRARQVETQIHVLRRITVVAAAVVALGGVMLTFDQVRVAGAGLLASAGVLGLIIGVGVTPLVNNLPGRRHRCHQPPPGWIGEREVRCGLWPVPTPGAVHRRRGGARHHDQRAGGRPHPCSWSPGRSRLAS